MCHNFIYLSTFDISFPLLALLIADIYKITLNLSLLCNKLKENVIKTSNALWFKLKTIQGVENGQKEYGSSLKVVKEDVV